jgi:hypothetical protein
MVAAEINRTNIIPLCQVDSLHRLLLIGVGRGADRPIRKVESKVHQAALIIIQDPGHEKFGQLLDRTGKQRRLAWLEP